jgi:hypothetical protein
VKLKLALVAVVRVAGPPVTHVSAGVVSFVVEIVHARLAGVGSTLPAASVARTEKLCEPAASPV